MLVKTLLFSKSESSCIKEVVNSLVGKDVVKKSFPKDPTYRVLKVEDTDEFGSIIIYKSSKTNATYACDPITFLEKYELPNEPESGAVENFENLKAENRGKLILPTKEKVLALAEKSKYADSMMRELFPDLFRLDDYCCNVGDVFTRDNQNGFYTIEKTSDGFITFKNITTGKTWSESKRVRISDMRDAEGRCVTFGEFQELLGSINYKNFSRVSTDKGRSVELKPIG